jgi:hypothetical protein
MPKDKVAEEPFNEEELLDEDEVLGEDKGKFAKDKQVRAAFKACKRDVRNTCRNWFVKSVISTGVIVIAVMVIHICLH